MPWARQLASGHPDPTCVFICYRHHDQDVAAHWLHREASRVLAEEFRLPAGSVFIDHSGIGIGRDFEQVIEDAIAHCRVMLALIDRHWLDRDAAGRPRLHDPDDPVRREIELGFKLGVPVVPVLIGSAAMPTADDLPESLDALTRRHAITLRAATFEADAIALARELGSMVKVDPAPASVVRKSGPVEIRSSRSWG